MAKNGSNIKYAVIGTIVLLLILIGAFIVFRKIRREQNQGYIDTNENLKAFLHMIRWAEGTDTDEGYRKLFGGGLFNGYDKHPQIYVPYGNTSSSAAGAYQILYSTWSRIALKIGLDDFTPASQDLAAVELIREKGALDDVLAGNFTAALYKIRKVWASLPGAGYGQPEKSTYDLTSIYLENGGAMAA